jgi:hypothetical protein
MSEHVLGSLLEGPHEAHKDRSICLGPTFNDDDCGELVVRNDVGNRSEIAETLRFGFYPDILRAKPCFLRDIATRSRSADRAARLHRSCVRATAARGTRDAATQCSGCTRDRPRD